MDICDRVKKGFCIRGGEGVGFFVIIILLVFLYDFTKLRQQNQTLIDQNEKIISLLEELKNKS